MTKTISPASSSATAVGTATLSEGPLNVYKHRWLFIGISLLFLLPGLYFIVANMMNPEIGAPLRLGIDFKGGTLLEYGFSKPVRQNDIPTIRAVFDRQGYTGSIIQIQDAHPAMNQSVSQPINQHQSTTQPAATTKGESKTLSPASDASSPSPAAKPTPAPVQNASEPVEKAKSVDTVNSIKVAEAAPTHIANVVSIRSKQIHGQDDVTIRRALEQQYGSITVLQKISMGPALARELFTNGLLALGLAYLLIMGYLTFRFQFDFAVCAMVALLHDTVFLIGMFALFGALFNTEVDSLFVTAVLTVVGFSVHDTIVVFDRIRENTRIHYTKKLPFTTVVNASVNQTLTRSVNTSLTALLTMLALYVLGGETTRDFVLAIIIGIAAGTYSSIFNASVLLAMWRARGEKAA